MHRPILSLIATTLLCAPALADVELGRSLHQENCISCHASRFDNNGAAIYTRADRRVNDRKALHAQVNRCKNNLGLSWFDDEVKAVADYLNATYYKFEQ
ncbi:MAG: c-type cytochrome [Pseudomonadota bacterium]